MPKPGFADRQKLAQWADTVAARTELPRLVRRLIQETTPGLAQLGMPAGEGVSSGGWDGTVKATRATAWVPEGLSVWEVSADKSPKAKADADYSKRLSTPDGSATSSATYVALSLRLWSKRADWARDRTVEKRWREVKAYGLDEVEAWLEAAPVTWAWFSELLGLHPHGLRSAESWWASWAAQTEPSMSPEIVLAGRAEEAKALMARLNAEPQITTIAGASLDETQAFIAAVAVKAAAAGDDQLLARMVFVDDLATWRELLEVKTRLLLVPATVEWAKEVKPGNDHQVLGVVRVHDRADICLPKLDSRTVTEALRAAGMSEEKRADEHGRLARRSLTALRRRIAVKQVLHMPPWAKTPVSRAVRAMLLASSWSDNCAGDKEVLQQLAGEGYEEFREKLVHLAAEEDPLVIEVGGTWHLVSTVDAWLLLCRYLTPEDLQRFEVAIDLVIGEVDPALDLDLADRWRANLEGKKRAYCGDLRNGLASTLALLGVHGEEVRWHHGTGQNLANYLVGKQLKEANEDESCKGWASISDLLPLLAEAGPDAFLDAVGVGLKGEVPLLLRMFTDKEDAGILSPGSSHTGLLFALQELAWSTEHYGEAVDLLARLAEIDPGGRLANRPFASLKAALCPWYRETSASVESRLATLDGLRQKHPKISWLLMLAMLPGDIDLHIVSRGSEFRDWKPGQMAFTDDDMCVFVKTIVDRALAETGGDAGKWIALLGKVKSLPSCDQVRVLDALEVLVDKQELPKEARHKLWEGLHNYINRHRDFADGTRALPSSKVDRLAEMCSRLAPSDIYIKTRWLFIKDTPCIDSGEACDDYRAYAAEVASLRQKAVVALFNEAGMDAVRRLARDAANAWYVGTSLAEGLGPQPEDVLLGYLVDGAERADFELASAYFSKCFAIAGWTWLEQLLSVRHDLTDFQMANLLYATSDFPRAWEVADSLGQEIAKRFWSLFRPYGLGSAFAWAELAAFRLIGVSRLGAALRLLQLYADHPESDRVACARLMLEALEKLQRSGVPELDIWQLTSGDFQGFFRFLERYREVLGVDALAALEWAFLPVLGDEADVPSLHGLLAEKPSFFVEVVSACYHPRSREASSVGNLSADEAKQKQDVVTNAWRLLESWQSPPGLGANGLVDRTTLRAWVTEAQRLLREADRLEVGEIHIGQILASVPTSDRGQRPAESVRDLLEELQSERIEDGLEIAFFNERGITSRGLEDGGAQERDLAASYREAAACFSDRWPRTARIFRSLSDSYENEARHHDEHAERVRSGLD